MRNSSFFFPKVIINFAFKHNMKHKYKVLKILLLSYPLDVFGTMLVGWGIVQRKSKRPAC